MAKTITKTLFKVAMNISYSAIGPDNLEIY